MRIPNFTIILGTNGTGKTTLINKLIKKVLKTNRRVLVVTPDDIEWSNIKEIELNKLHSFRGIRKIIFGSGLLEHIYNNFHNGFLVMDDFKAFGITNKEHIILRQLVVRRR